MTRAVRAHAHGRTELAGNHTDHQGGRAIAATLDCGIDIEAQPNGSDHIHLVSEGFAPVDVDLSVAGPLLSERGTTAAIVRGVADSLAASGLAVGGFDAVVASTIPAGGGLSSSAAIELALICAVQELFGNGDGPVSTPAQKAKMAVQVERDYFGKPCGLLDQTAIAYGGVMGIDFAGTADGDTSAPAVEPIDFDFDAHGLALCLIDTHCDHSLYTEEYAQVAYDMFEVAHFIGAETLSQVPKSRFVERFGDVRRELGDLPALRALHYYHEMALVEERATALKSGDVRAFLTTTRRSSASSAQYLQNVSTSDRTSQPAMVALALADCAAGNDGACRIHGGGFGGTIQAFVPAAACDRFIAAIDSQLGEGSCRRYRITARGAYAEQAG